MDRVLLARGIDPELAETLSHPSMQQLHDPALLPDIDKACRRLLAAIADGETIAIYGDYDVDGITASAVLYHTITAIAGEDLGTRLITYIPHRLDEGYGLNAEAIKSLALSGARTIISVDCGITATEEARIAKDLGVDLIITDHHNPPSDGSLPDAHALIHPRIPGSVYPFGELCGAGVAYKLAWRLLVLHDALPDNKVTPEHRELLLELLAFASLGTVADLVPLIDENRIIARFGLRRIQRSSFGGLRELVSASGLDGERVNAEDVGFRLGPRLNACGRMGHAAEAVELFTTAPPARAREIAQSLHRMNLERRETERAILEQAIEMAEAQGMTGPDRRAIVLASPDWHPGVVGIVCSRLVERFARPSILLCQQDGCCKGSGRSIPGFNLHAGLEACRQFLTTFGGHDMAAGLKLDDSSFDMFSESFIKHACSLLRPEDLINEIAVDTEADTRELTPEQVTRLDKLRPFGQGNPKVRFLLRSVSIVRRPETFGSRANHLALHLSHEGAALRCIMWNGGHLRDQLAHGQRIDAVISPAISSYSGRVEPVIEDWREA
ncbi:MAG TPA: single-stranded-DNA-specific exonuclease RecJ [Phycisphaerales bacterium]|nr:single-stranded-DNA-specific exonuclease RecJ [Phycisphaerales bacterium]